MHLVPPSVGAKMPVEDHQQEDTDALRQDQLVVVS